MATKSKQLTAQAREDRANVREAPQEQAQTAQEAPQSQAVAPAPVEHRATAPVAPKATSGNSPQVVVAIREHLAAALYSRHSEAILAGIEKIEAIATNRAHPSVAAYKAEVLDYLRGRQAKAAA